MEIWKSVLGNAKYQVSNLGRVRGPAGRILRPGRMTAGHMSVAVGRGNSRTVHSLVLEAFVSPRRNGLEGRHLNGDPFDNRLANLAWGTRAENNRDKFAHGICKLNPASVRDLRRKRAAGWLLREIASHFGISIGHASAVANGERHAGL